MKTKPAIRASLSLLLLLTLPAISTHGHVVAIGTNGDTDASGFCTSVHTRADAMSKRLDNAQQTLLKAWKQQADTLQVYKTSQDEKIQDLRGHIDAGRAKNIAAMRSRASTAVEKQAVDAYAAKVAAAVQARRQAVDAARATFRKSVETVVENHQAVASGEVQAVKIGTSDAYAAAASSCSEQFSPVTVHATLVQALAASRQNFAAHRKADNDSGTQIARLAVRRRASVSAANQTFESSMATARSALQAAWSHADSPAD